MDPAQNESLRHAVLEILAPRYPAALNLAQLTRNLKKQLDFPFTGLDLESALEFLRDSKLARVDFDSLGPTQYWSATHDGVLHFERNLK